MTHPYWEFVERGYTVDIFSPDGGALQADPWSHPRDESKDFVDDLISLGFIQLAGALQASCELKPIGGLNLKDYDVLLCVGGQAPMYTFYNDERVHDLATACFTAGKITAVLCHATCILLKTTVDGTLLVDGKTWTGFANSEEKYADNFVGKRIQPFWIEDEARKLCNSTSLSREDSRPTRCAMET